MNYKDVSNILLGHKDDDYLKFSKKLLPNIDNIIGVRLPVLRKIAKKIAREDYMEFIATNKELYFEDIMLEGLIIGYLDKNLDLVLPLIKDFIPKIYNWSICDSFCSNLKIIKTHKEFFWEFIKPYFFSNEIYSTRFALVVFLNYYIEEKYLLDFFKIVNKIDSKDYYVEMALAWALSYCYMDFPKETYQFLLKKNMSKSVTNKTVQKIRDSKKVSKKNKDLALKLKIR